MVAIAFGVFCRLLGTVMAVAYGWLVWRLCGALGADELSLNVPILLGAILVRSTGVLLYCTAVLYAVYCIATLHCSALRCTALRCTACAVHVSSPHHVTPAPASLLGRRGMTCLVSLLDRWTSTLRTSELSPRILTCTPLPQGKTQDRSRPNPWATYVEARRCRGGIR